MKIETKEATVTSNVPQTNVTKMSISLDGMEHIMSLLTNLYKDPELAVIREYFTNAVDAHVESGQTKPVEITLPTWDAPTYVVKDHGVGMTQEDIENVYAQYGASTKRDTNDQVGAFGLGCKSALTIATQFTVVSIKDGWKSTALFSKEESGSYTANVVSHVETSDENGTTVKIPVNNVWSFNDRARDFFKFTAPGTVLVDGQAPTYALENAVKITSSSDPDYIAYTTESTYGESFIIMGNVPYVLSGKEVESSVDRLGLSNSREVGKNFFEMPKFFPVKIGDVDLTPSREGLRFTDKTNALVDGLIKGFFEHVEASAQEEIDTVQDLKDLKAVNLKWKRILGKRLLWNGEEIPDIIRSDKSVRTIERREYAGPSHSIDNVIDPFPTNKTFIVTGYSADKYAKVNGYITPFMTYQDLERATFVFTEDTDILSNDWILKNSNFEIISGEVIIEEGRAQRKIDREANKGVTVVSSGRKLEYPVLDVDSGIVSMIPYNEIPDGYSYLYGGHIQPYSSASYVISTGNRVVYGKDMANSVKQVSKAKFVVLVGGTRTLEAFQKRVPNAINLCADIRASIEDFKSQVTDEVKIVASKWRSSWFRNMRNYGLHEKLDAIADKYLAGLIEPDEATLSLYENLKEWKNAIEFFQIYGNSENLSLEDSDKLDEVTENLSAKYPIVSNFGYSSRIPQDHILLYINAVHESMELAGV